MANPQFPWPPLPSEATSSSSDSKSIRLLRLSANRRNTKSQPRCSMFTVPLDEAPPFAALSYSWGGQDSSEQITCNDTPLSVTPNVHKILQRLGRSRHKLLWIDALCINQSDVEEKNAQVQQMGAIYERASQVLVWFGDDGFQSEQAVRLVRRLAKAHIKFHELREEYSGGDSMMLSGEDLEEFDLPSWEVGTEELEPLYHLFTLPWFGRNWVVQEVALAREIVCIYGEASFSWSQMERAFAALGNVEAWVRGREGRTAMSRFQLLSETRAIVAQESDKVLHVMNQHRQTMCGDPKDKIYAMNGILEKLTAQEQSDHQISIPTTYQIPLKDVYMECAHQLLEHSEDLRLFCNLRMPDNPEEVESLPSWVPDWRTSNERPIFWYESQEAEWNAGASSSPCFSVQDSSLLMKCQRLDEIVRVSERMPPFDPDSVQNSLSSDLDAVETAATVLKSRRTTCPRQDQRYLPGESKHQAYYNTLYMHEMDDIPEQIAREEWQTIQYADAVDRASEVYDRGSVARHLNFLDLPREQRNQGSPAGYFWWQWRLGSSLARTRRGYYCNVPFQTQCGDEIVLCAGDMTPFVVRSAGSEKAGHFQMIGACYVEGIMHGEAWNADEAQDVWFD